MTTEQQLRDTLGTYAEPAPAGIDRIGEVRGRIRVRRQRRAAGMAALALAVVAAGVGVPLATHHGGAAQQLHTVAPQPPIQLFPQYADGGRALGGDDLVTGRAAQLTYVLTPTSYRIQIDATCTEPAADPDRAMSAHFAVAVSVNGHRLATGDGCFPFSAGDLSDAQASRSEWQQVLQLGRPNTVTLTVAADRGGRSVPNGLGIAAATYQAVPFDAYPLPPRPATLPRLEPVTNGKVVLDAPGGGAASVTYTLRLTATSEAVLDLYLGGPGLIDVSVDGHHEETVGNYDWSVEDDGASLIPRDLAGHGVHVRVGQVVTVTLVASHFASGTPWLVTDTQYP